MTALAKAKARKVEQWNQKQFTLASGLVAWKGGKCAIIPGTNTVGPAAAGSKRVVIGTFYENVDATSAAKLVNVLLDREVTVEWFKNSGTNAVVANDFGSDAYFEDDQTVGTRASAFPFAGMIWGVSATDGVAVEAPPARKADYRGTAATIAFASNDAVIADNPPGDVIYDVPTTAAASTVTLPAAAREGTQIIFCADGTKNGHTVQYRDATGPVNLTTALTASKRHEVVCVFFGGKWFANAYVSP